MRRVLLTLLACAVVVAVAWFIADLPGSVTATVGNTTFQAGVSVVALGLVL
jgi:hypothetical protein